VILSSRALLYPSRVHWLWNLAAATIAALLAGTAAHAQTDEIQVYDAEINNPGEFSLQLHNNYTPIGRKFPDFPGGIVPNHTLNGASRIGVLVVRASSSASAMASKNAIKMAARGLDLRREPGGCGRACATRTELPHLGRRDAPERDRAPGECSRADRN
jgi:hypothetical protein